MKARRLILTLVAQVMYFGIAGVPGHATPDAELSVTAELSRDTIGSDETALLEVVVAGEEQNLPAPQLPTLGTFDVYSQGRSSNVSIVNGVMSSSVKWRYLLVPKKPGVFLINNIRVVHKNKRYTAEQLQLTVLDKGTASSPQLEEDAKTSSGESRDYFLVAEVDNTEPYVNEQVTLTLKFYTAVQYYSTPDLTPPTTTGFWTEVLGSKPPYLIKLNNRNYRVIEIKYALFPTQTGKLSVGRAMIRTTVAARQRGRGSVFDDFFGRGQEITVRSQPIAIDVQPLPMKGRPADFTGTIGQFSITTQADKKEVEVNQPVSVTITITGWGNVKSVAEPPIEDLQDFRVYRASSNEELSKRNDRIGGKKVFEEVFIPNRPGKLEIPPLSFSYFDPERGAYRTETTAPIRLTVTPGEGSTEADLPYNTPGVSIGSEATDIRYIKEDLGDVRNRSELILFSPTYLIVNGLPVLALLGFVLVRIRREKLAGDVGYARSRSASRMAKKRLATAKSKANTTTAEAFYAELTLAVTAYIADKLNISPHGLTRDRIRELLTGSRADDQLTSDTLDFLRRCDFARFAPASITADAIARDLEAAERIMVRMEGVRFA